MGILLYQGKISMVEPGIEPGTLLVLDSVLQCQCQIAQNVYTSDKYKSPNAACEKWIRG
jgi:hypothetical protein